MKRVFSPLLLAVLLAGCAAADFGGLVAGKSTSQEVEARMGQPSERVKAADGDTVWFYPKQPYGRQMYAVRIAPDGRMRSMEQTLTEETLRKLAPGSTTKAGAREIIGPPYLVSSNARLQREVWEYTMYNLIHWEYYLYLQFSPDGILREYYMLKDYQKEPGGTKD